MASLTLYWHQYVLDDMRLPDDLYAELKQRVYQDKSILWDRDYRKDIIVSIYDDNPWLSVFCLKYSDYILSSTAHNKTYEW
jgi:hypothetical protein